ncbi:pentapeptide repeat-containing protein [Streptomyces sp. NPDC048212]|uniref:pentapeptide repeat-containing protein n=1 Tax=unclassified Streptomyces TaxID=2593676 RepID=UPI0022748F16|nr:MULTISPECIES: pentapeptide repeat-containing protein [unclassified Streptomyces]MCY1649317.1 pentapeptide repeat-containing protein [Streptomyces sp. SL203]MCY1677029.1 pentapeptide repeat-containing protein [Streptomyces sp. SL294]
MTHRQRPRSLNERELRLWRVGRALTLTFAAAVLVAGGVFYGLVVLLDFQEIDSTAKLNAATLFDLVKLSFGVVAGSGALVALVVAYRRQRVDEAGAHREATRLHTERFSQAVDKLGSDSPAIRLGGVHALTGLADDAPDNSLRQTCIDVLCAYLRLRYSPDPGEGPAHLEEHHHYLALREVRHTILRLIGDHYRRPKGTHRSWQGCDLDLTGVTIDGDMDFRGATFSDGAVSFVNATFSGGVVNFRGATFSDGVVSFVNATFSDGVVSFVNATFSGSTVNFDDATFSDGDVNFDDATFSGSAVSFGDATFSGSDVYFDYATFSGGVVNFRSATFSGNAVSFGVAEFSGSAVHFDDATFSGSDVSFGGAEFSGGLVYFRGATFSDGAVSFDDATFSGSDVLFDNSTNPAPQGLRAAVGTPPHAGVTLPSAWLLPAP